VQLYCVMRGDLGLTDQIVLDSTPIVSSAAAYTQQNSINKFGMTFKGIFEIIRVRHFGNFRSENALDWITTLDCIYVKPS